MMKKHDHKRALAVCVLISIMSATGCGRKDIQGVVNDVFGNGVEGVTVKILKSTFTTTTNQAGEYSIDYVPGTFTLQFSKLGYTTHNLELAIQKRMHFPAEPITICPIPKGKGVYYIGKTELIELPSSHVRVSISMAAEAFGYSTSVRHYVPSEPSVALPLGQARFIDTSSHELKPARLDKNANIQLKTNSTFGKEKYLHNGFIEQELQKVGEEQLILRTIELQSGRYAWTQIYIPFNLIFGAPAATRSDNGGVAFPFLVQ